MNNKASFPRNSMMLATAIMAVAAGPLLASDWPRFRGPDGMGISGDENLPLTWSETENLKWKTPLPGPGSSSPIVLGKRVFITCYSGYGTDSSNPGSQEDLKRHLLCINRSDGKIVWSKTVDPVLPEDPYRGYIREHGYASSTPITDGQHIYVYFGKTGALAFDMEGKKIWQTSLGTGSSNRRWGSAASPILHKNMVIVNASEESLTIYALDKATGNEIWKARGAALELAYGTPFLTDLSESDGRKELAIAVPEEVWGLNPDTGKLLWYAEMAPNGNICPSIIGRDGIIYVFGGFRIKGSLAIRAGGKDDVTQTHVLWSSGESSYVPSPVIHSGHLYLVNDMGVAYCIEAKSGKVAYRERLSVGGGGKPVYASVVLGDGKLYVTTRKAGVFVLAAEPQFRQLANNKLESDTTDFNGSPAISNSQIFLRSNKLLYCIAAD